MGGLVITGLRALASCGLLSGFRPWHLPGVVRAVWHGGLSPATLIGIAAAHRSGAPGVIDDRGTITYGELDSGAARLAEGLAHRAERPHIAILCRNHRGFVLALAAAGRLGSDVLLLNTDFSGPQLAAVLDRSRPDLVIADEEFLPHLGNQDVVVAWRDAGESEVDRMIAAHPPRAGRGGSGAITILTSGTTGTPKGAPRRPDPLAMLGPAATILDRTSLRAGDAFVVAPPLFHGFGLAILAIAVTLRGPVVLRRRFDPETTLADVERHGGALLAAVPVMLQRILALPDDVRARYRRDRLHTVFSGAAPLRPELAERLLAEFGDVLFNGYGSSEVGIASVATPADLRAAPGTVGKPSLGVPIRVLDEQRRPVSTGRPGTIFVGGALLVDGIGKEIADGLMSTGDLGHFDAEGRLHVDGRTDDMIVSGGENVFPQEVEDLLTRHPAIADAVVVGTDDAEFGQRLVAYVVARGARPDPADLREHVKANLARYKVPRSFVFLDELPRNPTGKVVRRDLPAD
ncbi:Long-chain-fatty-acid--CoA ligase [Alloactinosynnema sp. L-07]|uniref:AMP-binding protein n=1 Tax=Alloactinosynnema sp. L-07 TaxID=1653480 RepID=UPI00065F0031|nr:AMP-binding protein [Alloactinosynnema sp. L-07]CRK56000.1 Long-chain-fatty-acid--CoA ligase [Alloactinosynnema sp. L-07]